MLRRIFKIGLLIKISIFTYFAMLVAVPAVHLGGTVGAKIQRSLNPNTEANIETTNVAYDLKIIFGGESWEDYNIHELIPTEDNSTNPNFKFITMKSVDKSMYFYVYNNTSNFYSSDKTIHNAILDYAMIELSFSKDQNMDTGKFNESFSMHNLVYLSEYGNSDRFYKFKLPGVEFDTFSEHRVFVKSMIMSYEDGEEWNDNPIYLGSTMVSGNTVKYSEINDELFFSVGENNDFVYHYFKDNTIVITEKEVGRVLYCSDILGNNEDVCLKYNDHGLVLFNTNLNLDEIVEVKFEYIEQTIDVKQLAQQPSAFSINTIYYLAEDAFKYGLYDTWKDPYYDSYEVISSNHIIKTMTEHVLEFEEEVTEEFIFSWAKKVKYKIKTLIDNKNLDKLREDYSQDYDDSFYSETINYINSVNDSRANKYKWSMFFSNEIREVVERGQYYTNWIFTNVNWQKTRIKYVEDLLILKIKARDGFVITDYNVLDIPTDETFTTVLSVPFKTINDKIIDTIGNIFGVLQGLFNLNTLIIIAVVALGLFIVLPIVSNIKNLLK